MYVVKKDNTKEAFNVQKVVNAVNKSAFRVLVKFTDEEKDFICSDPKIKEYFNEIFSDPIPPAMILWDFRKGFYS